MFINYVKINLETNEIEESKFAEYIAHRNLYFANIKIDDKEYIICYGYD